MVAKRKKVVQKEKTLKQMERHLKGVANHRRIAILFLIAKRRGITVDGIAENLDCNVKTISSHLWRLAQSGLILKVYRGRTVAHELSPYGKILHKFLTTFSQQ